MSLETLRARLAVALALARRATVARAARVTRSRTLVTRLLLLLVMGAIIMYVIGIAGLWWTSNRLVEDGLRRQAVQWITEMDELGPALYAGSRRDFSVIEGRIKNFPEIAFVRYYDATGRHVLHAYGQDDVHVPLMTSAQRDILLSRARWERPYLFDHSVRVNDSLLGGEYVRVLAPVRVSSIASDGLFHFRLDKRGGPESVRVIGYLDLGINPNAQRDSLARNILRGGLVAAFVFLIAVVIGRRLIKRALAPLTALQMPLARLASGETDVRVDARGDAEIVAIGNALNVTIGAIRERDATLRKLAEQDPLTGLINRNRFLALLEDEIQRVGRDGTTSALLFIDLDRFKYVNDAVGHTGGDKLLTQVADLLRGRMRESDVVARFGGDEFTLLARNVSRQGAVDVAQWVRETMRDFYFVNDGRSFTVCCSIGIAMITARSRDAQEVVSQADDACFEAKATGRNRFYVHEADHHHKQRTLKDIGWSERVKQALKDDGFSLVFQPIVPLAQPVDEYYEVLLRLPDANGRRVSPAIFLPVAERFGLLADIDRWVIAHALQSLAQLRALGRDVTFAINLSGPAFEDPATVQLIKTTLERHNLPASALVLEITEQIAVRYMEKARRLMQGLIDMGVRFSLDDFGVGFSSFSYLKHLPASFVKIDGSFVEKLATQSSDQAIVKAMAQIARSLDKQIIAEFVQDEATVELLRRYKVDYVQGHYIGMPTDILAGLTAPAALASA